MGAAFSSDSKEEDKEGEDQGLSALTMAMRKRKRGFMMIFCGFGLLRNRATANANDDPWLLAQTEEAKDEETKPLPQLLLQEGREHENSGEGEMDSENADQENSSSFRFTYCQESDSSSTHTVLYLNLEKGSEDKLCWSRIDSIEHNLASLHKGLIRFKYEDIRLATCNFSEGRVLGRGAHSCVYKGRLSRWRSVAVKRLKIEMKESDKDFCRELHIAGRLRHSNIVSLVGYCVDSQGLFLVYKFVSGGSLEYHLHKKKGKECLTWSERFKIAKGIAKALLYLHGDGTRECVVHRDIKPSNILLTFRKTPKVCDFGLATTTRNADAAFVCKSAKGTFGYLAPEYFQHGKVSAKTDTYAFGVVLLELLTGRKPIDDENEKRKDKEKRPSLLAWASPMLSRGRAEEILDGRLRGRYKAWQARLLMLAAHMCLHPSDAARANMEYVLTLLRCSSTTTRTSHGAAIAAGSASAWAAMNRPMPILKHQVALVMDGLQKPALASSDVDDGDDDDSNVETDVFCGSSAGARP